MQKLHKLVLGLGLALPLLAAAQWQWLDKDGRKVFSDRPPPADIPSSSILARPSVTKPVAAPSAPGSSAPAGVATAPGKPPSANLPKLSGKDKELELKKKKAEDELAGKKLEEEQKAAKINADNCERSKRAKATLQSGVRVARTGATGEREFLDDAARASEVERLDGIMRKSCAD